MKGPSVADRTDVRIRALLFLPATRPDRLEKAFASGADRVCVDLEDALAPDAREEGRAQIRRMLVDGATRPGLMVRVNAPESPDGRADLELLDSVPCPPGGVMIPKAADPARIAEVARTLAARHADIRLHLLVETARGIEAAFELARCAPQVSSLMLGGVDLSTELGCAMEWEPLLYSRSRLVSAAAAAGVPGLDTVRVDLTDDAALTDESRRARALGFSGKAAIHPRQIPLIHHAFTPSPAEVANARRVVAAWDSGDGGVALLDGRLLERPVVERARRILEEAHG